MIKLAWLAETVDYMARFFRIITALIVEHASENS